jgi:hypothetical protein
MLADELDYVVGVDTHRDQHVLAVVAAPTGSRLSDGERRDEQRAGRQRALDASRVYRPR